MSRPRRIAPFRDALRAPSWLAGVTCVPLVAGVVVAISRLPWTQDHTGVVLGSVIFSGFLWWLLESVLTGCYRSNQGNYDRWSSPLRYWVHVAILIAANVLLGCGWIYYFRQILT